MTGVTSVLLSTSSMAVSLGGIEIIAGTPMAGLGLTSIPFSVESKTFNQKIAKNEKNISIAGAKHLSGSELFSKAI